MAADGSYQRRLSPVSSSADGSGFFSLGLLDFLKRKSPTAAGTRRKTPTAAANPTYRRGEFLLSVSPLLFSGGDSEHQSAHE